MKEYKYCLKEPIYMEVDGKPQRVKSLAFGFIPKYHIVDDNVYICCQAKNIQGEYVGLAVYLPITLSEEEFMKSIEEKN